MNRYPPPNPTRRKLIRIRRRPSPRRSIARLRPGPTIPASRTTCTSTPRTALVVAPTTRHALRASYNRSVGPPAANLLFGARLTGGLSPDLRATCNVPSMPGFRVTFTGRNVLGDRHREFVGSPALSRMLMGRLVYELPSSSPPEAVPGPLPYSSAIFSCGMRMR
jgi:hypothetical protein